MAEELKKYDDSRKFKYEELKGKNNCPTGVDASRKEVNKMMITLVLHLSLSLVMCIH